jgi:hypothetical protein
MDPGSAPKNGGEAPTFLSPAVAAHCNLGATERVRRPRRRRSGEGPWAEPAGGMCRRRWGQLVQHRELGRPQRNCTRSPEGHNVEIEAEEMLRKESICKMYERFHHSMSAFTRKDKLYVHLPSW